MSSLVFFLWWYNYCWFPLVNLLSWSFSCCPTFRHCRLSNICAPPPVTTASQPRHRKSTESAVLVTQRLPEKSQRKQHLEHHGCPQELIVGSPEISALAFLRSVARLATFNNRRQHWVQFPGFITPLCRHAGLRPKHWITRWRCTYFTRNIGSICFVYPRARRCKRSQERLFLQWTAAAEGDGVFSSAWLFYVCFIRCICHSLCCPGIVFLRIEEYWTMLWRCTGFIRNRIRLFCVSTCIRGADATVSSMAGCCWRRWGTFKCVPFLCVFDQCVLFDIFCLTGLKPMYWIAWVHVHDDTEGVRKAFVLQWHTAESSINIIAGFCSISALRYSSTCVPASCMIDHANIESHIKKSKSAWERIALATSYDFPVRQRHAEVLNRRWNYQGYRICMQCFIAPP